MKPADRRAILKAIDIDVMVIQRHLDECYHRMVEIVDQFQADRRDLLRRERRQSGRPQSTSLFLLVSRRERRVLHVPMAEWRVATARGRRITRALDTLAKQRGNPPGKPPGKGHMGVMTRALPKNRNHGWRTQDLVGYANAVEVDLVKVAEEALRPLRRRVASLATKATRLLQARYQHQKALEHGPAASTRPARGSKRPPAWANPDNQLPLALSIEKPLERPQLKNPDGY